MTPTETRYAHIEKSSSAHMGMQTILWVHIVRKSISLETDYKPLMPFESSHILSQLPLRIKRFRMRLMRFHFKEIKHVPGKKAHIIDALSRLQARRVHEFSNWRRKKCIHTSKAWSLAKTTADYGSAGGGSCLQTDQSVLLLGMAWKVFIKGRDGIVVVK